MKAEAYPAGFSSFHHISHTYTHARTYSHTKSHKSKVGGLEAKGRNTAVATAFTCKRGAVTMTHSRCEGLDLCSSWFMLPFYLLCPSTMVTAPSHKPKADPVSISSKSSVVAAVAQNEGKEK